MQTVSADLLRRYDRPGPRYTSYPTAVEFHESVGAETYALHLERASKVDAPLSFYIHLPFCEERCLFCGCNVVISKNHGIAAHYLPLLHREIRDVARRLRPRKRISQYHWGGGTPTYLAPAQMRELQAVVKGEFEIERDAEVAIEVDPRVTTVEQMETLRDLGFNRLSMGVQDFTPDVQEAVNRIQPYEQTRALVETGRRLGFQSVNIDLIYGLPLQTPGTFAETLKKVVAIRPDRLAVYSYAHVPWLKGQQRKIDEAQLPKPETKLELFVTAHRALSAAGYVSVGMDHFALPEDEMGRAILDGTLWRNFMGYTVKHAPDMIACGVSGIGDVSGAFFQNEKNLAAWQRAVSEGRLPIERGYVLTDDDKLRRHLITSLMCAFRIDVPDVEKRFRIRFWERFAAEREALKALEEDGFVKVSDAGIEVVGLGRLFVRNVCMTFDAFLASKGDGKQRFSRTV